ncbi:hypothetical protein GALMADRAFT_51362 [Galerina marginata CBS 339.88]|uniref:Uncharacterized protein n=1 Tax=Galerina marginata (strain CBS 339.88) TaxID=685588 RepID=A0A067U279_GALM3|nr:hypothetical protein GALMADRAFT_51362 [Galerina marginata CBS 339.88]
MAQIIKDWVPQKMSDADIEEYRHATQRKLDRIRNLEAEQQRLAPQAIARIEQALFMARVDYRTCFFRIFRINKLPPEILSNVFHFVAWTAPNPHAAVQSRLWLTSICRHWRTVALDDPTLWNAIWFRNPLRFEQGFAWLDRAGNASIDIRINDTPQQPLTLETATLLINRVFKKLSNIRVMIIVVQDWDPALFIIHSLRRVAEERLPMVLERFELHRAGSAYVQVGAGYEPSFYLQPMALFGGASVPSFRYLAVNGVHLDWEGSPLVNLTALDIRRLPLEKVPSLHQFRAMLQNSPDLGKLVLDGAGPQWPVQRTLDSLAGLQPISLPNLKVLVLGDFSTDYGAYVASQIIARNVVDLTLMNLLGTDSAPFFTRLTGNLPAVKSLTLHTTDVTTPRSVLAILKWLQSLPLLTYLRVVNVPRSFLDLFLYDSQKLRPAQQPTLTTSTLLCPKIAYFEFHSVDPEYVSAWARSRAGLGFPLRKLFVPPEAVNKYSKEQLDRLKDVMRISRGGIQVLSHAQRSVEEEELTK